MHFVRTKIKWLPDSECSALASTGTIRCFGVTTQTRHRGICLGFDIDSRRAKLVAYRSERPRLRIPPSRVDADQLLYTKFLDWQYEEEWRNWIQIDEPDPATGIYFYTFDSYVQLREVIIGPLCEVPKAKVKNALRDYEDKISVVKARLAFNTCRVVKNLRGFPPINLDHVHAV